MTGYIHSRESFGAVDGPGIRYVLFMQGCPMRCKYCHNPDTWNISGGSPVTPAEIIDEYSKNLPFYKNGGITVTGGEPLLQLEFVTELFTLARSQGIHTCLDTSGATFNPNSADSIKKHYALLNQCDLVMLDIKHIDSDKHKALTGMDNSNILAFARHISDMKIPLWIRHVVVPGISDNPQDLTKLGEFIGTLSSLKALDVLPYHTMGVNKYKELGIPYSLENVKPLSEEAAIVAKKHILDGLRLVRSKV